MEFQETNGNTFKGIIGATIGALLGMGVWVAVAVLTEHNIGYIAVLSGFLTGFLAKFFAKKSNMIIAIYAVIASVVSIFLGNALTIVYYLAEFESISFMEVLKLIDLKVLIEVIFSDFNFKDVIFLLISAAAAFQITNPNRDFVRSKSIDEM